MTDQNQTFICEECGEEVEQGFIFQSKFSDFKTGEYWDHVKRKTDSLLSAWHRARPIEAPRRSQ